MTWGIVPAAGRGTRIQPLAFSKELLPVGSRTTAGGERPCAVSEYLLDRMLCAGADRICFVISPGKWDIMQYFGAEYGPAPIAYVLQPHPTGLCDAIFRAEPVISRDEGVFVGLPDTVWFPEDALKTLPNDRLAFLLFPVDQPQHFDAVVLDASGEVREIRVKHEAPQSHWIWGAFRMPGHVFADLKDLWLARGRADEYIGTLVNAYLAAGGKAVGVTSGSAYVDVGTLNGYRTATALLAEYGASRATPAAEHLNRPALLPGATLYASAKEAQS